jgi:hypothetical protein
MALLVIIAFASARVRRWAASPERGASDQGVIDMLGLGGAAVLMFVGADLMTSDGTGAQGFLVAFLGGPLLIYLTYSYPRGLRTKIEKLERQIEELRRQ